MKARSTAITRPRQLRACALTTAVVALGTAGCSGTSSAHSASAIANASRAPLPAAAPRLLMTDGTSGWAVWPSGALWVLLRTSDAWRDVTNGTPIAVPTGGGLVVGAADDEVGVAVEPFERLTQSPILTRSSSATEWNPAELPGPVADARDAVAISGTALTAVLDTATGGALVRQSPTGWTTLTTASALGQGVRLRLDGIRWASAGVGWLTGHGPAGAPSRFRRPTTAPPGHRSLSPSQRLSLSQRARSLLRLHRAALDRPGYFR